MITPQKSIRMLCRDTNNTMYQAHFSGKKVEKKAYAFSKYYFERPIMFPFLPPFE